MSQEQVLKTLMGLGLTRLDSQVYIYLAKKGPQKGQDLSKSLKVQKQQLYRSLKNLESKGIVSATLEHPARFSAVSFDKVVDIFVKSKMAEAQRIQENKNEILANWQAIAIGETGDATAKFNLIEGRGPIYAKILQMMRDAKNQLSTISTVAGLLRADQFGLFDTGIPGQFNSKIRFRALTELSEQNLTIAKNFLKDIAKAKIRFEARAPDLSLTLPQLVIKDEEEILFFITPKMDVQATEQEDVCLWTNCRSLVQAFTAVFEEFWRNATNINAKITQIETGKPAPKTQIIENVEVASQKYDEAMKKAEREITIITSPQGLKNLWRRKSLIDIWAQKNVLVKIMAPITSANIDAAQTLKRFEVRHVPLGYLETTVVDGKHLFQFKNSPKDHQTSELESHFEDAFYTNDTEYVEKTKIMLNDIWKNAQAPSALVLKSIIRATVVPDKSSIDNPHSRTLKKMYQVSVDIDEKKAKQPTGQDILDSILNAQKMTFESESKAVPITYSTNGQAVIHPPSHLHLPDMIFHIYHIEKHSTFGVEDMITVHLWLETPMGNAFVPAAIVTTNPEAAKLWRRCSAGSPAENNVNVVKENEIDVRLHGNTLCAAWTVPLPLPERGNLPPSCLLIEGYGDAKATAYDIKIHSGFTLKCSGSILEAFVTFLHPLSRYSGPGTDGVVMKDTVIEWHPPQTKLI